MSQRPHYARVWQTFFRNSVVREMTFRGNFLIEVITRTFWFVAQIVLFEIIYSHVPDIRGWTRPQFFAFMATGMLVNSLVEAFFLPNCANFSELVRTGNLDFALLKPIDPQFLVSFERIDLAELIQVVWAGGLLWYGLDRAGIGVTWDGTLLYLLLVGVAVAFFYCLMITLASTSIFLGRNQSLYDFWFYITVFARYPQSFFRTGGWAGEAIWFSFSFILPILLVITIPAQVVLNMRLNWEVALIAPALTLAGLFLSRRFFQWSLLHYRSASS